ncbi:MAG: hypothetical protein H0V70_10100 [Ktedonobacteraceae bacterium]|nr:hypothetical protein [Ktedonobacteraceae bacterium]
MIQCPQCNFENIRNRFYCEECGTLLPSSTSQQVKTSTSRSQENATPTAPLLTPRPVPLSIPGFLASEEHSSPPPSLAHDTFYTTARILLYLVGAIIAAFGLYAFLTAFTTFAIISFLAMFPGSILLLILIFNLHRAPRLNWWQRLFGELATTGGALVLLLIGAVIVGLQPPESIDRVANIVYGSIIMIYGIAVAVVALW